MNYRARMYDPDLGRFYAMDPAGQFSSPYLYVGNNPLIMVDPDGEWVFLIGAALNVAMNWKNIYQNGSIHWGKLAGFATDLSPHGLRA